MNLEAWLGGVGAGLIACAVLMANNLRDVAQDKAAGKRTLAVLVGPLAGRILFAVFMLVPFAIVVFFALFYPTAWLVLFALLLALPACVIVLVAKTPRELSSRCSSRASPRSSTAWGSGWRSRCSARRRPGVGVSSAFGARRRRVDRGVLLLVVVARDRLLAVAGGVEVARHRLARPGAGRSSDALRPNRAATAAEIHGFDARDEQHGERHGEQQDAQRGVPDPDGHGFHPDSVGRRR